MKSVLTTPLSSETATSDWAFIDLLPIAACICDRNGVVLKFNRQAETLWGGVPDLDADGAPAEILRTGTPVEAREVEIRRPDGRPIACVMNSTPLRDGHGTITGAIFCFQDITGLKKISDTETHSVLHLSAIVETTPECVKIVARDGTLLHMNTAGRRMVEAESADDVVGRSFLDLIAPECIDLWQENHTRVCDGEKLNWEFSIIGLQGARRDMETHAAPLALADGTIAQLAITRDITERKKREGALRAGERWLREILDALPAAIYTTDAAGKITFFNEAAVELAGRRPELGSDEWCVTWRLYHPDGTPMPHDQCPMAVALRENRPVRGCEAWAERPDGTRILFTPYPMPLRDASGKLVGAVNMLVDMTAQKRAEAELRRLNETLETIVEDRTRALVSETEERRAIEAQLHHLRKMEAIGQLTGGVAHDFNNLLTAVTGNLSLIAASAQDNSVRDYAAAALRAADRGAKLTHQLLAFSRKQELHPRPTNINELVSGMGEMLLRKNKKEKEKQKKKTEKDNEKRQRT